MAHVVLPAEKHRKDPDHAVRLVDFEPVNRPPDGEMTQARQNMVVAFAPAGRGQDALRIGANLLTTRAPARSSALSSLSPKPR